MKTHINQLRDLYQGPISELVQLEKTWDLKIIRHEDNMSYLLANRHTLEAIIVDPSQEDLSSWISLLSECQEYRFLFVIDTHTHADHISAAAYFADHLGVPLLMHQLAPSKRVDLRVTRDLVYSSAAGGVSLIHAPGHTEDGLVVFWGPFIFTGDTVLYGDVGRDDLPGGDPRSHYVSVQRVKAKASDSSVFLPGHDGQGRVSSWRTQLEVNSALIQDQEAFVREAGGWTGPPPKKLKESLFANFQ
jgi:glyoxylase-like metal-dependent hydrolase (beta-lactamase superfamily II)